MGEHLQEPTTGSYATYHNSNGSVTALHTYLVGGSLVFGGGTGGGTGSVSLYDPSGVNLYFTNNAVPGSIVSLPAILGSVRILGIGSTVISGTVPVSMSAPWVGIGSVMLNPGSLQTYNVTSFNNNLVTGSIQFLPEILGSVRILGIGSTVISGTVPVSQSTNPWIVLGSQRITQIDGIGSSFITNPTNVGSLAIQTIAGSITLQDANGIKPLFDNNRFAGSIVNLPSLLGSIYTLGSQQAFNVTSFANMLVTGSIQSLPSWLGVGSVVVSGTPFVTGSVRQFVTWQTEGEVAHDGIDVGSPIKIGGKAYSGVPVGIANGDRVNAYFSPNGHQAIMGQVANGGELGTLNPVTIGARDLDGVTTTIPTTMTVDVLPYLGVILTDTNGISPTYSSQGAFPVAGETAHDSPDAGNPVKIGAKATDYEPDVSVVYNGSLAEVTENDRVNITSNRWGQIIEGVNPFYATLGSLNALYQSGTTTSTKTSTVFECWNYRQASFNYELYVSGAPTDMLFEVDASLDGTNYAVMQNDFLGDLRESTASITATGIKKSVTFPIACQKIRVKATSAGASGTVHFIVSGATLYLRN